MLAEELDVPLLGQVPLTMALREQADAGLPVVLSDPADAAAQSIDAIALRLIALTPVELPMLATEEADLPPLAAGPRPVGMSLPMA